MWSKPKDWNCITIWPNVNQHFLHIPQFWHSQSERCKCTHVMEQHSDLARREDIEVIFSQNSLLFALCIRHEIKNHQSHVSVTKFKFSCMHLQLCLWETSRYITEHWKGLNQYVLLTDRCSTTVKETSLSVSPGATLAATFTPPELGLRPLKSYKPYSHIIRQVCLSCSTQGFP